MKTYSLSLIALLVFSGQVSAQDISQPEWKIMPGLVFVNYFPSTPIRISPWEEYNFDGVGFLFIARAFHSNLPDIAFNLSSGINWFGNPNHITYVTEPFGTNGVGRTLRRSFRTFPLMVGLEWIYPRSVERAVMFYAGGNVGIHFVDGNLDIDQQTKFGYTAGVGFIVKVFEFGVRYYSFSDLRNLGVHLGLRFNSFLLE